jgi:hypothetical protein
VITPLEYARGRGLVVVFSIKKFKELDERHGTEKDVEAITNTFQSLGHEVRYVVITIVIGLWLQNRQKEIRD